MADRGSHFVTTLNRTKRKRKGKGKEKIRENKLNQKKKKKYIQCYSCNNIASSFGLYSKKDMNWKRVSSSQIPALVESSTVVKDVMSCFDWI